MYFFYAFANKKHDIFRSNFNILDILKSCKIIADLLKLYNLTD